MQLGVGLRPWLLIKYIIVYIAQFSFNNAQNLRFIHTERRAMHVALQFNAMHLVWKNTKAVNNMS